MKYIKELVINGKGIFSNMVDIHNEGGWLSNGDDWLSLDRSKSLDVLFNGLHGDTCISTLAKNVVGQEVTESNLKDLSNILYHLYYNKWGKMFDLIEGDLEVDDYFTNVIEELHDSSSFDNSKIDGGRSENIDMKNVYNHDTMIVESEKNSNNDLSSSDTGSSTNTRTRSLKTSGSRNKTRENINKVNYLDYNNLSDYIFKDVVDLIGIRVY